jgi:hypothetical protein
MKDMVAVTVLLAGFAPYLVPKFDSDIVYQGWGARRTEGRRFGEGAEP